MSSDAIQQVVQKVTEQTVQTETTTGPGKAGAEDVAKFEKAMQGDAVESPKTTAPKETETVSGAAETADEPKTLGDAILEGMEKVKESHEVQSEKVNEMISQEEPMTMGDMMRLQYELMQLNLQQDLTTKVADKTGQGVQTLFKNQ